MPEIGEVRGASELGYRGSHKYVWAACVDCGKKRWIALSSQMQGRALRCSGCAVAVHLNDEALADLHVKEGLSAYTIAKRFGVRQGTVLRRLKQLGVFEHRSRGKEVVATKQMLDDLNSGKFDCKTLAEKYGLSYGTMKQRLYNAGVKSLRGWLAKRCVYCGVEFYPWRSDVRRCSQCHSKRISRWDKGNKRRYEAAGFEAKTCQICGKRNLKRYHVHHATGKDDPESELAVLCPGCHGLVSRISWRKFVERPVALKRLIEFVLKAKHIEPRVVELVY